MAGAERPPASVAAPGIPFTPAMARALALSLAKDPFLRRYELDPEKTEEVVDIITRRLMQFAHEIDTPDGQALAEHLLVGMVEMRANIRAGTDGPRMPIETGKQIGKLLRPVLPRVREVFADITREVRPHLPVKQQLKLAGDMVIANSALDALDGIMERWERGQISPYENPLDPWWGRIEHSGNADRSQSWIKERAERWAETAVKGAASGWQHYVEQAKKLYEFDESQLATADSILRECIERSQAVTQDETWRNRLRSNRLWCYVSLVDRRWGWDHPFVYLLVADYQELKKPLDDLEAELKRRIDEIPTAQQRRRAEEKVAEWLSGLGFKEDKE